jgi:cytidine deaminase
MKETISFTLEKFTNLSMLIPEEQALLQQALDATSLSYAPYSNFKVGAAALLNNGEIIVGSNQENASFGATICAERTLLGTIATLAPQAYVTRLAIRYISTKGNNDMPISPCGICRQALVEYQNTHKCRIKVLMAGKTGSIWVVEDAAAFLPLAFSATSLE